MRDILLFGAPKNRPDSSFGVVGVAIIGDQESLIMSASLSSEGDDYPIEGSIVSEFSERIVDPVLSFRRLAEIYGMSYQVDSNPKSLYSWFANLGEFKIKDTSMAFGPDGMNILVKHQRGLVEFKGRKGMSIEVTIMSHPE